MAIDELNGFCEALPKEREKENLHTQKISFQVSDSEIYLSPLGNLRLLYVSTLLRLQPTGR